MSYRLIDASEIAIKYPEVNEMDCIYVDLPNGLDNEYHYIDAEPKHGRWIERGDNSWECSVCHEISCCSGNYCPDCGARMDGGESEQGEPNCDYDYWQGRYCIECLYLSSCFGAGIDKPACKAFVPRVRYVDCKDGGENG